MKFNIISFGFIIFFLAGCSKFLDVQPKDLQTSSQLYSTKSGFYMASNGVYNGLAANSMYGRTMTYEMMDIIGKRYIVLPANQYLRDLSQFAYTAPAVASTLSSVWQQSYSLILAGNIVIENIHAQKGVLTVAEANILEGEMLAVRAFLHLDMLRLFGPRWNNNPGELSIPYNEETQAKVLPLLPFEEIINKIINDLDKAEQLLAEDPVIVNGPMASEAANESIQLRYRQFRFNYYAVKALKARAYLYGGKKIEALATSKQLLSDAKLNQHFPAVDPNKLLANFTNPDRVFSSEVLTGTYVRTRDEAFTRYFSSETAGSSFLQPHDRFIGFLFSLGFGTAGGSETQDYRFQSQWETAVGVGLKGHVFTKYKAIARPDQFDESSEYFYSRMIPLLRLSEVYYIAAECEPLRADGFEWLNRMRTRRGLVPIASTRYAALSGSFNLLLSNEYLREFYGEGQAFYFFKRLAYGLSYENGEALALYNYTSTTNRPPLPAGEMK